ncbi:UNVERIFIED_CONTAM: hypothetical protein Cloal_1033 [Acetivibrio alkalicellulosi]
MSRIEILKEIIEILLKKALSELETPKERGNKNNV